MKESESNKLTSFDNYTDPDLVIEHGFAFMDYMDMMDAKFAELQKQVQNQPKVVVQEKELSYIEQKANYMESIIKAIHDIVSRKWLSSKKKVKRIKELLE